MASKISVLIASDNPRIREMAQAGAAAEGAEAILCGDGQEVFESAKNHKVEKNNLRLLVLEAFLPKIDGFEVVNRLQEYEHTKEIPVLMFIGNSKSGAFPSGGVDAKLRHSPAKVRLRADNYLEKPFEQKEIQGAIHSMIKHYRGHAAPHPVTGIPGHVQIEQEVFGRFTRGETFSLIWADVNYFRPFNDRYGLEKGNEVLKTVAEVTQDILKSVKTEPPPFFGHVGGDDFVVIVENDKADHVRNALRQSVNAELSKFYSKEERENGFFKGMGRDKKEQVFPLMNYSMVVLKASLEKYPHYGQIVSEANEILHQTKIGAENLK